MRAESRLGSSVLDPPESDDESDSTDRSFGFGKCRVHGSLLLYIPAIFWLLFLYCWRFVYPALSSTRTPSSFPVGHQSAEVEESGYKLTNLLNWVDTAVNSRKLRGRNLLQWGWDLLRFTVDEVSVQTPLNDTLELVWRGETFGNGLVSKRAVPKHNVVWYLPPETLISDLNVHAAVAGGIFSKKILGQPSNFALGVYLAVQKKLGRASRYTSYIELLPDNFWYIPRNWMRLCHICVNRGIPHVNLVPHSACYGSRMLGMRNC